MQLRKYVNFSLSLLTSCCLISSTTWGNFATIKLLDFEYSLSTIFKPETFYGKNINLLNNNNDSDRIYFSRHTLDITFDVLYGKKTYNKDVAEFSFTVRNRSIWGNPESIARTTEAETKILESIGRPHRHAIPRHIFWMREGWLLFDISQALSLPFSNKHTFTTGAFSFELGRGISLGDAFAVGPEILGFYTESVVDQYAFGGKFNGDILTNHLSYDLYTAILQNKSTSLSETAKKILGQEFDHLKRPERGSGKVNFLIAGRLNWEVFNNKLGLLNLEPYALFNSDPEQRVEFLADASSKLGTIGFAGEYYGEKFEGGFDYALNLGQQRVKGWDRNQIEEENRDGFVVLVNNHVCVDNPEDGPKALYAPNSQTGVQVQKIIDESFRNESQNGKKIGSVNSVGDLFNTDNRFRNPFTNRYEGWMFVIDASYWIYKQDLKLAVTAGVASGDDNPNFETKDGKFDGFIPLQEIYSGKRVKSAFVLGGAGKLRRPLSTPTTNQAPSKFAQNVSGFSNLIFFGNGLTWEPKNWQKGLKIRPNILAYWEERSTGNARTYLGAETNIFVNYCMLEQLKFFFVASIFFPGTFYADRKGLPITARQEAELDRLDRTGFVEDRIPDLGNDIAYTFNIGLTYEF